MDGGAKPSLGSFPSFSLEAKKPNCLSEGASRIDPPRLRYDPTNLDEASVRDGRPRDLYLERLLQKTEWVHSGRSWEEN